MNDVDNFECDEVLEAHLRRTLKSVADTVIDDPEGSAAGDRAQPAVRRRARRSIVGAAVATLVLVVLGVGWQQVGQPGQITRIPTDAALVSGSAAEGGRWWLIPSTVVHPESVEPTCQPAPAAVDFVSEASNRSGDEWNTGGVGYGEPSASSDGCPDEAAWFASPARFDLGSTRLGPSDDGGDGDTAWGFFAALHPTVHRVRVTVDDDATFSVDTVTIPDRRDGPRFAAFTAPPETRQMTVELLTAEGSVVTRTWAVG